MAQQNIYGFKLSPHQERAWLLREAGYSCFNQLGILIQSGLSLEDVLDAARRVVRRHEILSTIYQKQAGRLFPLQVIGEREDIDWDYVDLTGQTMETEVAAIDALYAKSAGATNNVHAGPLLRLTIARGSESVLLFILRMPAISSDIRSLQNIAREMACVIAGEETAPDGPALKYTQFSEWQNNLVSNLSREGVEFWEAHDFKAHAQPKLFLETDNPLESNATGYFQPAVMSLLLAPETVTLADVAAQAHNTSRDTLLLACWTILVGQHSSKENIIIGRVDAGREYSELQGINGPFSRTLPVLSHMNKDKLFSQLVQEIQQAIQEGLKWPEHFDWKMLSVSDEDNEIPFFSVCFESLDAPAVLYDSPDLTFSVHQVLSCPDRFKLKLCCRHEENALSLDFYYDPQWYTKDAVRHISGQFDALLQNILRCPDSPVGAYSLLNPEERRQILCDFNHPRAGDADASTVLGLFDEQAAANPHALALVSGEQTLTYHQLEQQAATLAHRLRNEFDIRSGTLIGIMASDGAKLMTGILAILKAGGAYVPLDPSAPAARNSLILSDSGIGVVLLEPCCLHGIKDFDGQLLVLENLAGKISPSGDRTHAEVTGADPAYVIYTSGTTGQPKGVVINHGALVNYVLWLRRTLRIGPRDSSVLLSSYAFDLGYTSIWGTLLNGGSLHFITDDQRRDTAALIRYLARHQISYLKMTPSMFAMLVKSSRAEELKDCAGLRLILLGGEPIRCEDIEEFNRLQPDTVFVNHYGPTEATIGCIAQVIDPADLHHYKKRPVIGRPISNMRVYVCSDNLELQPVGIPGELHVSGAGVACGYVNAMDLTARKFIAAPFQPGERIYRTGDVAMWLPDGTLELLGRSDDQVKIRGYRVEPGEVEACLREHPAVREVAVEHEKTTGGDISLVAYIVPDSCIARPIAQLCRLNAEDPDILARSYELPNGMTIIQHNQSETDYLYREIFSENVYFKHGITLHDGDVLFDVGANIGMFTLFAWLNVRNIRVYAFEPITSVYTSLQHNTSLYGVDAHNFPVGLSDREESAVFNFFPHNTLLSGQFADAEEETEVVRAYVYHQLRSMSEEAALSREEMDELLATRMQCERHVCRLRRLSSIIHEQQLRRIDLLKVDAQKGEANVLRGIDEEDWPKIRQVVIEVHDENGRLRAIQDLLSGHGFATHLEQDASLSGTNRYNLYAVRASQTANLCEHAGQPALPSALPQWISPGRLITDLVEYAKSNLPDYMVPSEFILRDSIPLTPNGKVNKQALDTSAGISLRRVNILEAPRNALEEKLLLIWKEVLGREEIGVCDNFFELGGHSLKAIQLISCLSKEFGIEVTLNEIFDQPTIRGLSAILGRQSPVEVVEIHPIKEQPHYALSHAQTRLWVLSQVEGGSTAYNMCKGYSLVGALDVEAFRRSLSALVHRHESLRTTFMTVDGEPRQQVHASLDFRLEERDHSDETNREQLIMSYAASEAQTPFDFCTGPLLRATLIRLGMDQHVFLLTIHHIVCDGWSLEILLRELFHLYEAERVRREPNLPALRIQYKDYTAWQNALIEKGATEADQHYWLEKLSGNLPVLELPTDDNRPPRLTFNADAVTCRLDEAQIKALAELCRRHGASPFMLLLTIIKVILHRYTGQEDIIVGTPVAGRDYSDLHNQVGCYVNTIALRDGVTGNDRFSDLLERVKRNALEAYEHRGYPFDRLVMDLKWQRDARRTPVFNVGVTWYDTEELLGGYRPDFASNLIVTELDHEPVFARTDWWFFINKKQHRIDLSIIYNSDLFSRETMDTLASHLSSIVRQVLRDEDIHVCDLDLPGPHGAPCAAGDHLVSLELDI